ncbi:glycosyltransferase family 2 protein [Candidatus Altiarchaeota archaeon]
MKARSIRYARAGSDRDLFRYMIAMASNKLLQDTPRRINVGKEKAITIAGTILTLLFTGLYFMEAANIFSDAVLTGSVRGIIEISVFTVIVVFLIYGSLVYHLTRLGRLNREDDHAPVSQVELDGWAHREDAKDMPALTILVPSYKEDLDVVEKTLMSAALQEYPNRQIVLLIDDPPEPGKVSSKKALEGARRLPGKLTRLFREQALTYEREYAAFVGRIADGTFEPDKEQARLIRLNHQVAGWFRDYAERIERSDHVDSFFADNIIKPRIRRHEEPVIGGMDEDSLAREYRRLTAIFNVELTGFERKKYANLSREPNKAMNLNSYIMLMGGSYRQVMADGQVIIERSEDGPIRIPDAEFLITLDADSMLLSDYALRLAYIMAEPGNDDIAIIQTPYNTYPHAKGLERVAGATTDIQYLIHQGFTRFNATFWVGANALIRRRALEDIRETVNERGYDVNIYIQDRTVIEDTESTVDLVHNGWRLYNYPSRLSFSATPPDLGSLAIQRQRWANGGLIIAPKLLKYLARGPIKFSKLMEGFMRFHYLASIAFVNFGVLAVITYPFESVLNILWLPLSALPYFMLYARDLRQIGYGYSDTLRVYALNLVLIPINIAGVLKSIQQAYTGQKIPFGRTPKIQGRTSSPVSYLAAEYGLFSFSAFAFLMDVTDSRWVHATFSLANSLFFAYGIIWLIGVRETIQDFRAQLKPQLRRLPSLSGLMILKGFPRR